MSFNIGVYGGNHSREVGGHGHQSFKRPRNKVIAFATVDCGFMQVILK
jgi:hypothetical protein